MFSKKALMDLVKAGLITEVFTFIPDDTGEEVNYSVTALRRMLADGTIMADQLVFSTQNLYEAISATSTWEQARVDAMTAEEAAEPVLVLQYDTGHHVIADGRHRIVYAHQRGITDLVGWMVAESAAPRVDTSMGVDLPWGETLDQIAERRNATDA